MGTKLNTDFDYLVEQIDHTPLVPVLLDDHIHTVWCKLEFMNPSGSIKDRIARHILQKAGKEGFLKSGHVVEASSGSTSIALAHVCALMGLKFTAVLPEGASEERLWTMVALGAQFELVPNNTGMLGAIERAEQLAKDNGWFFVKQFENNENANAHYQTGLEIIEQIPGHKIDAVVSGIGTGGTLVGLARCFKQEGKDTLAIVARTEGVRLPGTDIECCSLIPGTMMKDFPNLYTIALENESGLKFQEQKVSYDMAMEMTKRLWAKGYPVGPSSGFNYAAAVYYAKQENLGEDTTIVTVFPDRMERYFSTESFHDIKCKTATMIREKENEKLRREIKEEILNELSIRR